MEPISNPIGKIVKSNSHIDYICQIFGRNERDHPPAPDQYAFGRFVRLEASDQSYSDLVGVIYNTILMNPEFGVLGPRLSPVPDLEIFSPDYLNEKITLVGILAVGTLPTDAQKSVQQGIPSQAAEIDTLVYPLSESEFDRFHAGENGAPRLAYLPTLLSMPLSFMPTLALVILDRVASRFPGHAARLNVLRNSMAWRTQIEAIS